MKRIHGLAASLVLVAALAACAPTPPEPTPTKASKPTASAIKPTPKPTPTMTIPPLAIPDCETLLPVALAKDYFSENTEFLGEFAASEYGGRQEIASIPVILPTTSPNRVCYYGIPNSDGSFSFFVAGITAAERATLQGELSAAGYTETTMGTVTAFELAGENEVGSLGFTHLFTGDTWIVVDGTSTGLSGAVAGQVLDVLRATNPALGL